MIDDDQIQAIREALGLEFIQNHFLDKQAIGKFANILAAKILEKEIPEAYAAGFTCAGGDPNEAMNQGGQYLECVKAGKGLSILGMSGNKKIPDK
jgi:hypothetical protein